MPANIEDWLAICETKARYCRMLDTKQWDAWADVFTEDLVMDTVASGGTLVEGRDAAIAMVRAALGEVPTAHQVHNPEITIDGDTAEVIWAMQDRVAFPGGRGLVGYGHYHERYVRRDGGWRIAYTRLTRLHLDAS
ncbi:MAG: nuclear transport factor 2 family protein [Sphingomonadales bacterium]|nr:nuclear transport factor 2 family protein [Sphingomonadales bacterium]